MSETASLSIGSCSLSISPSASISEFASSATWIEVSSGELTSLIEEPTAESV